MMYKFERLEVYQLSLEYIDAIYDLAAILPRNEDFNLRSQIVRAATSIALNIAEGSTGQSDSEQGRFLSIAFRSLLETIACRHIIIRRNYIESQDVLIINIERIGDILARKLQAMRNKLIQEDRVEYVVDGTDQDAVL